MKAFKDSSNVLVVEPSHRSIGAHADGGGEGGRRMWWEDCLFPERVAASSDDGRTTATTEIVETVVLKLMTDAHIIVQVLPTTARSACCASVESTSVVEQELHLE